jgi:two-component system LytT family sensor kinase
MKYKHVEIAVSTIILIMALFSLLGAFNNYITGNSNHSYDRDLFEAKGLHFNFFINFLIPFTILYLSVYGSFLWIACGLPDKFIAQRQWGKAIISVVAGIMVFWLLLVVHRCLLRPYLDEVFMHALFPYFNMAVGVSAMILAYEVLKHMFIWLLNRDEAKQTWKQSNIAADVVWFILLWGISVLASVFLHFYWGIALAIILLVPCVFLVYLACVYWIIPQYYQKVDTSAFWARIALATLAINVPFNGMYATKATNNGFLFFEFFIFCWLLQIAVLVPVSLYVYKTRLTRNAELTGLKTELGITNAGLQYLRSQINPHFLFNALNTLYGTALLEKADKTGDGIQKLGDMMRFMLHENNQDRIALSRELEYLHNYIDLQNMRLALSPDILIDIQIEDIIGYYEIAPMLLIPFVENAYKHGISHQAKSWINVNLYKKGNTLHLDVYNSTHPVNENDPERFQSGTGLDNVKQRLQLLYPQKHELVVRQSPKEFFVHLSLILDTQKPA